MGRANKISQADESCQIINGREVFVKIVPLPEGG
jgi:hypothetical protein